MRKLLVASALVTGMTLAMTGCIAVDVHRTTDASSSCSAMQKRVQELERRMAKLQATVDAMQKEMQTKQEPVAK
jgi:peptidoglycan hydrolase CwlO-like protein